MTTTTLSVPSPARDSAGRALLRLICLLATVAFLAIAAIFAALMLVTSTVSDLQVRFMEGTLVVGVFALVLFCLALPPVRPSRWLATTGTITAVIGLLFVLIGIAVPSLLGTVNPAVVRAVELLCVDAAIAAALIRVVWSFPAGPRRGARRAQGLAAALLGVLALLVAIAILLADALPPALGTLIVLVTVGAAVAFVLAPILAGATLGPAVVAAAEERVRRAPVRRRRPAAVDSAARVAQPISPDALPPRDGIRPPSLAPDRPLTPEPGPVAGAPTAAPAAAVTPVRAQHADPVDEDAPETAVAHHAADGPGVEDAPEAGELTRRERREALEAAAIEDAPSAVPASPEAPPSPAMPPPAAVSPATPRPQATGAVPTSIPGSPPRAPEDYIVRTGTAAEEAARKAERDAEAAKRSAAAAARSTPGSRPPRSGSSRILTLRLTEGQATWLEFVAAGQGADRNTVVAEAIDGTIERYRNAESADGTGDAPTG